jgi:hypothetical protein
MWLSGRGGGGCRSGEEERVEAEDKEAEVGQRQKDRFSLILVDRRLSRVRRLSRRLFIRVSRGQHTYKH